MKILTRIAAIILLFSLSASAGTIQPPKNKFQRNVYNATFALYGSLDGETHFLCTATAYEKTAKGYHLISAGHCVRETPLGVKFSVAEQIGSPLMPVDIVKSQLDDKIDFSVFELQTKKKYPMVQLGTESGARIGDTILNVNFSEGAVEQVSKGIVSSIIMGNSPHCPNCEGYFMVQVFGGPGSSGSAVVSTKTHKIIGIVTGGFRSNIGAVIEPISKFKIFLAAPEKPRVETNEENS